MNTLIALLHSRAGAVIQWIVGLFIGWLSSQLVALGIEMPAESMHQLTMGLSAIGAFLVTFAVQWYQCYQAKRLQSALGTKQDGWIGNQTVGTAYAINAIASSATIASTLKK
jgi:divalent metal cation (Fe/Co/Zn/Cd) transporter